MKNKIKHILNIFIAMTFLTQSMYADILDDAMKGMTSDVLEVSSYTSGAGTTNYYTGSMSIRFGANTNPEPIISFTPPSIEVGCNGIDVKGMFIALLGLGQLKDMLFDAGSSLAWGIAIGLIYTLPGVAGAFKWINAWAKKIQALLADACNAGTIIGEWAGEKAGLDMKGFDKKVSQFLIDLGPEDYADKKQEGESILLEALGWKTGGDEMDDEDKKTAIASLLRGVFESDASMLGGIINTIASTSGGVSAIKGAFGASSSGAVSESSAVIDSSMVNSLGSLLGSNGSSLTEISQGKMALFSYVLIYNFVGDLAINPPTKDSLESLYNGLDSSEQGSWDYNAIMAKDGRKIFHVHGIGAGGSTKASGEAMGNFIWYGTGGSTNGPDGAYTFPANSVVEGYRSKNKKLIAPKATIYVVSDNETASGSSGESIIPVMKKDENTRNTGTYYGGGGNYKGTIMTARCIVDWLVEGNGLDSDDEQSQITRQECNTEFVFPQLHKYIKIIKNSPSVEQFKLKMLLTKVTSIKMANAILGSIGESLGNIRSSTSGPVPLSGKTVGGSNINAKDNMAAVLLYRNQISQVMYAAGDFLEEKLAGEAALESHVESVFMIQARENRERGLKSLQK